MLNVIDLHKSYDVAGQKVDILKGVSFALAAGETLALTGESGSGKSTLLHLVGGLDQASSGRILLGDQDILALNDTDRAQVRRTKIGVIFQQFNLIPSLSVLDNIAFQARLAGRYDERLCRELAARIGLADHLTKYPEQLSGGQQQRVAIARAIAMQPDLILADEPTGNLDEATSDEVMRILLELVSNSGAGMLMVTHSTMAADSLDRRLHLSAGRLA